MVCSLQVYRSNIFTQIEQIYKLKCIGENILDQFLKIKIKKARAESSSTESYFQAANKLIYVKIPRLTARINELAAVSFSSLLCDCFSSVFLRFIFTFFHSATSERKHGYTKRKTNETSRNISGNETLASSSYLFPFPICQYNRLNTSPLAIHSSTSGR